MLIFQTHTGCNQGFQAVSLPRTNLTFCFGLSEFRHVSIQSNFFIAAAVVAAVAAAVVAVVAVVAAAVLQTNQSLSPC